MRLSPLAQALAVRGNKLLVAGMLLFLPACGAVITSEDVTPGQAATIGVIFLVGALYVFWVGLKK